MTRYRPTGESEERGTHTLSNVDGFESGVPARRCFEFEEPTKGEEYWHCVEVSHPDTDADMNVDCGPLPDGRTVCLSETGMEIHCIGPDNEDCLERYGIEDDIFAPQ